jgi:Rrf2 family protein
MDIPEAYLPHILGRLVAAGLVVSEPGRKGGYELARSPAEITMLEVVEAVEGRLHRERCALSGGPCHWDVACAVHPFWARAQDAFMEQLRTTTLGDIATEDDRLAKLTS